MERLKSKEQRQSSESYSEICEGQTCESNIDFPSETSEMEDIIGIPAKIELPNKEGNNTIDKHGTPSIFISDLETTGFCTYFRTKIQYQNKIIKYNLCFW